MSATSDDFSSVNDRMVTANIPIPLPPTTPLTRFSLTQSVGELKAALEAITIAIEWIEYECGKAEARKSRASQRLKDKFEKEFLLLSRSDGTEKFRLFTAGRACEALEDVVEDASKELFVLKSRLRGLKEQKDSIQSVWWAKKSGMD